jgi:hypothetical protein
MSSTIPPSSVPDSEPPANEEVISNSSISANSTDLPSSPPSGAATGSGTQDGDSQPSPSSSKGFYINGALCLSKFDFGNVKPSQSLYYSIPEARRRVFTDAPSPLHFGLLWNVLFGYYFTVTFGDAVVEGVHVVANEDDLVEAKTMEHVCKMLQRGQGAIHVDEQTCGQWKHFWIKLNFISCGKICQGW